MVPRRQPAPISALFAVPCPAAQGPPRRHCHAGLWHPADTSSGLMRRRRLSLHRRFCKNLVATTGCGVLAYAEGLSSLLAQGCPRAVPNAPVEQFVFSRPPLTLDLARIVQRAILPRTPLPKPAILLPSVRDMARQYLRSCETSCSIALLGSEDVCDNSEGSGASAQAKDPEACWGGPCMLVGPAGTSARTAPV